MKRLILHPTETSQWHALINEAQVSRHLVLNENTESYLVFLLMRFSQQATLMESIIALDFLEVSTCCGTQYIEALREVGDKSLLFCGLFPGLAAKRRVSVRYFSEMGQSAYLSLGNMAHYQNADLYSQLSLHFATLQKILQTIRHEYLPYNLSRAHFLAVDLPVQ